MMTKLHVQILNLFTAFLLMGHVKMDNKSKSEEIKFKKCTRVLGQGRYGEEICYDLSGKKLTGLPHNIYINWDPNVTDVHVNLL